MTLKSRSDITTVSYLIDRERHRDVINRIYFDNRENVYAIQGF